MLYAFTFHNVSIKSVPEDEIFTRKLVFTFHNVSIKSIPSVILEALTDPFTFHNVSIKSRKLQMWLS